MSERKLRKKAVCLKCVFLFDFKKVKWTFIAINFNII